MFKKLKVYILQKYTFFKQNKQTSVFFIHFNDLIAIFADVFRSRAKKRNFKNY